MFSQTEQLISGKIISQNSNLRGIEVINIDTKKTATTNNFGEFLIGAKINDKLIILTEKYINTSIVISSKDINKKIIITLVEKPIELDDVEITNRQKIKPIITYEDLAMTRIEKEAARPKNDAVYTGVITNGADFVQIGKMIGKLFKNKKDVAQAPNIEFKTYVKSNFSEDFLIKVLELKPNETSLFLDFCENDSKSKQIIKTENEFIFLDFLISKKAEFYKMLSENK